MLTFTSNRSRGNFQWIQILGVITAILMLGSSAQALTRGEKEIQRKLPSGITLNQASDAQILNASLAAIQSPTNSATLISEIVKAAMKFIPQNGPVLVAAGLTKVKSGLQSLKNSEAKTIVSTVMRRSLEGVPGELEKPFNAADRAAAITAAAVGAVEDLASNDTMFSAVIKGAVSVGAEFKKGSKSGAVGAVTGAIAEAAGVSNADVSAGTSPSDTKADALVTVIIRTAAKKAPSRTLEIAEASGYAFAFAYRGTTDDASEIGVNAFLANNLNDIIAAINAGLPADKITKLATQIRDRVQAGISLAYNGILTNGSKGVSDFAYVNGVLPDISNVAGL